MSTEILSGKTLAKEIRAETSEAVKSLQNKGIYPTLAVLMATGDESTEFYVRNISKAADVTGLKVNIIRLSPSATSDEIAQALLQLAGDKNTHGIILQTPLPDGVNADTLRTLIPLEKDVDGANPLSAGRLMSGLSAFAPTTAVAVMEILKRYDIQAHGTRAVIIGRSRVVGKPLAHLLLAADATVTICHSKTRDLAAITKEADILIVAIGKPRFIGPDYVKPGAIVIDVGTNAAQDGTLIGDVDGNAMYNVAGAFSPVPGGVGPVTTALLLKQTIVAAENL